MTYADYCLQFRQINYYSTEETPGCERHHLTPKAVQIEKYGRVIDDTCILVTREQHIEAHRLFTLEFPLCKSQEVAYRFMTTSKGWLGQTLSEDHRRKIRENHADLRGEKSPMWGKHQSEEARRKNSESHKDKPLSEHHKQRMSEAMKKRMNSPEVRQKLSKIMKEKMNSPEVRQKISEARKEKYAGENNPMYGKHHSSESKQKMSEARKATLQLKSQEYHEYKSQGGELKWQDWLRTNKER